MPTIEQQLSELKRAEFKKLLCIRCLVSGLPIKDSLQERENMKESLSTRDLICSKCYANENEHGHKKISRSIFDYYKRLVSAFEEYKNENRLG